MDECINIKMWNILLASTLKKTLIIIIMLLIIYSKCYYNLGEETHYFHVTIVCLLKLYYYGHFFKSRDKMKQ